MNRLFVVVLALVLACVASQSRACDGVVVGGGFSQVYSSQAFYAPQASFSVGYAAQAVYVPQQQFVLQRQAVYAPHRAAVVYAPQAPIVQKSVSVQSQRRGLFSGGRTRIVNRTVVR